VPNDVQLSPFVREPLGQSPDLTDVNAKEWWYMRSFQTPPVAKGHQVRLVFDGVDYFADVWLNGNKLGTHEGAYTGFDFDITDRLAASGMNYLAVRVTAPWNLPGRSHYEYMKGEFDETWDALPGPGQRVFPLGLHREVRLEITSRTRIAGANIWTASLRKNVATVESNVQVVTRGGPATGTLHVTIRPENFSGEPIQLAPQKFSIDAANGNSLITWTVQVENPQLWWTWDLGLQNLYRAEISITDRDGTPLDASSTVFGIRTLERDSNLLYRINGRPVLLRGAWYPMSKLYPASTDRWTYEKDLRLARNANMNHLINYTVVEKDDFYELADRLGILLFVELPFNQEGPIDAVNAAYPRRKEFIEWSSGQVAQIVRHLGNHPSIGIWAPVSEVTTNGHDFGVGSDPRVAEAADGYALFVNRMREVVEENDHDSLYFPSYCDFGEHHFWEGTFFNGSTYDDQFDASAAFVSEYGALGLFAPEDAGRVTDLSRLWNGGDEKWSPFLFPINIKRLSYAQPWQYFGLDFLTANIGEDITQHIRSLTDYGSASQIYQELLYAYAGDSYRRKIFSPINGIRSWMFKSFPEIPIGGFGVIDAFDTPTRAYYAQKRTFAPVAMSFAIRNPLESMPVRSELRIPVWISNATSDSLSGLSVDIALYDLDGHVLKEQAANASVPQNHAQAVSTVVWDLPAQPGIYVLRGHARRASQLLASANTYLKIVPAAVNGKSRVLLLGSPEWAQPIAGYLAGLGAQVSTLLAENTIIRPVKLPSAERLRQAYDVIWLAGYDDYWREAPPEVTGSIMDAVRAGCTLVHTGSPASFHGGGEKTAALDLTPLASALPVVLEHENDISLKASYKVGAVENEFASNAEHHLTATEAAPDWVRQIAFGQLAPESFHILRARPGSEVLIKMDNDLPMLVSGRYGNGKTLAYMGFSPEGSIRRDFKPVIVDRAIKASSQGQLFAMVSAILLALASSEKTEPDLMKLIESRRTPLYETLLELPPDSMPNITASWTRVSTGQMAGHIRIENGDRFTFGLRLRLDGHDQQTGRLLSLWSNQYFDLFPHETAECDLTLFTQDSKEFVPFELVAESHGGAILGRVSGVAASK
jgi:beta-mannosidase